MIADLTAALLPAGDAAYAKALTKLIEFAMAFGIPCGDPAAVQRIYREKLADLPEDLLTSAVVRVTDRWTWGQRLPMPAEIRATISPELSQRRVLRVRAELALMKARSLPPPSTGKPGTIPPEKWAELLASLSAKHKSKRKHQDPSA